MNSFVQHFSINNNGRDFVTGDIHGCFDLLELELGKHGFDPGCDRCFSVGDLVDRGPDSEAVAEWLNKSWFFSCLGNHEEKLLYTPPESDRGRRWFTDYGGEWWLQLPDASRDVIRDLLKHLPIAMEIETLHGKVGIVHADIPEELTWPGFIRFLQLGDVITQREALWGRRRATGKVKSPVPGIDRVICGHTVTPDRLINKVANVWFIDTGGFLRDKQSQLTVLPLDSLF